MKFYSISSTIVFLCHVKCLQYYCLSQNCNAALRNRPCSVTWKSSTKRSWLRTSSLLSRPSKKPHCDAMEVRQYFMKHRRNLSLYVNLYTAIGKVDILQTKATNRDVYVKPKRENDDKVTIVATPDGCLWIREGRC